MEHIINIKEVQHPAPSTETQTHHHSGPCIRDSMGSPVVSQLSHDYSLLKSSTPEARNPQYRHDTSTCNINQPAPIVDVRKFANPAPLGLCAFALTSFLSNCINLNVGGIQASGISVSLALNYGGIAQVLAGMWEMAVGNTFGATSFCSYGAYWITFALISDLEPTDSAKGAGGTCHNETLMGLFMLAWFIFTTLMLLCTLRSSLAMFLLFFFLDMNYLLLGIAHIQCSSHGEVLIAVQKAGGLCGIFAAFAAWWNAFAGIADTSNGFFTVPLGHFPWSPIVHAHRAKAKEV